MKHRSVPSGADYAAVALVSATGLAYEILLLRVFSYSQWHHFASLAVSLALLGFGAAGTVLVLLGRRSVILGDRLFIGGMGLGAVGMLLGFILAQVIQVRPLFAVWDSGELGKMLLLDFVAFIPFFGLALCIGQVFIRWPRATRSLYGANLLGSGLGALAAAGLLASIHLEQALLVVPLVTLAGAGLFGLSRSGLRLAGTGGAAAAMLLAVWIASGPPSLALSDFKRLAYLLDLPDAEVLERQPGLQAEVTVVRSSSIRTAPGLSLRWGEPVPSLDALALGSDTVFPLPGSAPEKTPFEPAHFRALLGSLPFSMRAEGETLVLGASEWLPLPAPAAPGRTTTWIQKNPQVLKLFEERKLVDHLDARTGNPRGHLAAGQMNKALVYLLHGFREGDAAGEDYLLTLEAVKQALGLLQPDGLLAVPLKLNYPPRYAPKMLAMLSAALRQTGTDAPDRHVAFLRSMQEGLFIVSPEKLGPDDIRHVREFASTWGFDLAALPGLQAEETNRFHQLEAPVHFQTAAALLSGTGKVPAAADWYSRRVPVDARPYFWKSMQWKTVPELLGTFGRRGLVWLDWALLATTVKLLVAGLLAAALILLPLGRLPKSRKPLTRPRVFGYFAALGLGFLLLEMAAFQRALLYLADPVLSAAVVFTVFLLGAGLGSLTAPEQRDESAPMRIFGSILSAALFSFVLLAFAEALVSGTPLWMRLASVAVAVVPLAWALGRAFPWGLRQLDEDGPLIPWAWGINGFFSVLAGPLATLLSVHFGQPVTWLTAAACYALAALIARTWVRQWSWQA